MNDVTRCKEPSSLPVEAVDYLFGIGDWSGRDLRVMPRLILLDLKLPKVDGLQVLQRVRGDERTREIPVIVLTSSDEESDLIRSYQYGASSYIRKSVNFNRFSESMRLLGLQWRLLEE